MRHRIAINLLLAAATIACGQTPTEFRPLPASLGDVRGVAMGFEQLRPRGEDQGTYAAWINLDRGNVVPLGKFSVNEAGQPLDENGEVIERFEADQRVFGAVSVLITIEVNPDAIGNVPAGTAILQGPFFEGIAELVVPVPFGIESAAGRYRVFTPTDGPDTNEGSGVWAIDTEGEPLLDLPPTNNIYAYEHFMIINGTPVIMGRFRAIDAPDTICAHCGEEVAPEVPGEDFLVNAPEGLVFPADLTGARLIVTLEGIVSDFADPSQLVVMDVILPAGLEGGEIIELTNRTALFPAGRAVIF